MIKFFPGRSPKGPVVHSFLLTIGTICILLSSLSAIGQETASPRPSASGGQIQRPAQNVEKAPAITPAKAGQQIAPKTNQQINSISQPAAPSLQPQVPNVQSFFLPKEPGQITTKADGTH